MDRGVGSNRGRNISQGSHDELFPLPLSSIERLHLHDDWPEFPNQIFARIRLTGELQPELANQSLRLVFRRHVWNKAVVRRGPRGGWIWDQDEAAEPQFVWSDDEPRGFARLDLTRGPACRLIARNLPGGCELTFQIHHALVDGLGGLHCLRDWLVIYDNLVAGRDPEQGLPTLEPKLLGQRNRLGLLRPRYWLYAWRQAIGLFGASKFLFRPFATIAGSGQHAERTEISPADSAWPHYTAISWEGAELSGLRQAIRQAGVSLNDWLLAALFHALDEWHRELYGRNLEGYSRLIVPINLRTADDRQLPAANRASLVQLDRRPRSEPDQLRLAQGISYELKLIRDWQLDRMFLLLVRGMSLSDAWLRSVVARRKPRATSMLTNLGRPLLRIGLPSADGKLLAGGMRLEGLDVVGPIRFGMPLSFAVAEYAGQMRLTAHYDSRLLSAQQVEDLAVRLRERVLSPPGGAAGKVSPN